MIDDEHGIDVDAVSLDSSQLVLHIRDALLSAAGHDASLIDVPLLERRRLLDAVLIESDVVRLGAFVRPPIDSWVNSWRSQGFAGLTYKAANSRYLPGRPNPEWVLAGMPHR